nr:hypothetical protein [Actinomycetales bacterium]
MNTCAGDNEALQAGVSIYRDPSTGELVELDDPIEIYLTQSQLQSLPIETGAVHVAGWSGQWLIHYPMPVHSDAAAHTLTTTVLGVPVEVRVTPVEFRWDYGHDVEPLVTSVAGAAYPDHVVEAAWTTAGEGRTVTATTQWQGEFRVQGFDTWLPVNGTASTTTVSDPVEVIEAPARLVPNP